MTSTYSKSFYRYCVFVLINIFLVIIAGSVVRTTQSGMGCPDWPKCFGQYVPPTTMEQVVFSANKKYKKGQFIIYNDSLKYANHTFESAIQFNARDWNAYTVHNYAKFEVYKTWIEYINRLLGALLGLFILIQLIWSFRLKYNKKLIISLSVLLILLTGFQAWLGKTVVDSNLAVLKISIHLAGAIAMLLVQLTILHQIKKQAFPISKKTAYYFYILALLTIVQFFMGVAVRQHVDIVSEQNLFLNRQNWLSEVGVIYYIHRSFSIVLLLGYFFLFYKYKNELNISIYKWILRILLVQLFIGILFNYANFPAVVQPFHLLLSSILLSFLFLFIIRKKRGSN